MPICACVLHFLFVECQTNWLIDRSIDRLIDWLIDRLIDWSIDRSIDWLIDGLIDWLIDRSIDWSIDWLIDWSIDWSIDWLIDWSINWLIDWLTGNVSTSMWTTWTSFPRSGRNSSTRRSSTKPHNTRTSSRSLPRMPTGRLECRRSASITSSLRESRLKSTSSVNTSPLFTNYI